MTFPFNAYALAVVAAFFTSLATLPLWRKWCLRIGLVDELVPDAQVIERAETVLKKIIANAPLSVKYALEAVNKGLETSVAEGLLIEASLFAVCASTDDKKEGTSAFLEKRAPKFQGK